MNRSGFFIMPTHVREWLNPNLKFVLRRASYFLIPAFLFHMASVPSIGNLLIMVFLLLMLYKFLLAKAVYNFQTYFWPRQMENYKKTLHWVLRGRNAYWVMGSVFGLFILTMVITGIAQPKVIFFPDNEPNQITEAPSGHFGGPLETWFCSLE